MLVLKGLDPRKFMFVLVRCRYITVDFATAASQNSVF
jgi:hypothetical protein